MTTTFRRLDFDKGDWDYVQEHIPGFLYVEDVRGIVALRKGKVAGMLFFDNWTQTCCNSHQIVSDPAILIEGFLEEAWEWVFSSTGAKRLKVVGFIPSDKTAAMLTAARVGFKEIARVVDGECLGVDQVIVELTKEDCRYL